jgi:membrane fusion protein, multidrug efflux system
MTGKASSLKASENFGSSLGKASRLVGFLGWCAVVILAFAVSGSIVWAHTVRLQTQRNMLQKTIALGPRVRVMRVAAPVLNRQITLPASIHGYIETPIYAKTAGYLKSIYVDKGDRVHKGEVLAILESPELDKQVADAKANLWLQQVTDMRNQKLVAQAVIPQQTADDSHAAMLQAKAAYEQLLAMQSYEVIKAETDGIITARYVDPGALIPQVTSPGGSTPILKLATLYPLRVYADAPQDTAAFVKEGDPATVTVTQYPMRKFQGTVTRHPEALAPDTRTMRVEVDLPNADSALYPGMYATVVLNVSSADKAPLVPDDAVIFRAGSAYAPVVRDDHIHLVKITLGSDDGNDIEVASGLHAGDLIALDVGDGVEEGEPVQTVLEPATERYN